jgi:hypothetical protein
LGAWFWEEIFPHESPAAIKVELFAGYALILLLEDEKSRGGAKNVGA